MGWRGVREEEEISGEDRENNVDQLFVIAGTERKCMALGLKKTGQGHNFNEQVTLFFWFLFLHNEGLTLVILARPKILRGYFVQLLWKLITTYLAVGSPFQGHIFESFGKKKCDRAFLKLRGGHSVRSSCFLITPFLSTVERSDCFILKLLFLFKSSTSEDLLKCSSVLVIFLHSGVKHLSLSCVGF